MRAILIVTRLTLKEALRRRIATAALALGVVFLVLFGVGLYFINKDIQEGMQAAGPQNVARTSVLSFIVMAGLYAGNFLAMMAAILVAVDTLAGEIASGVIETLCVKPVRRVSVLMGKWLGCAVLATSYVILLLGGVLLIARLVTGFMPPHVFQGLALILLEGLLLTTVTLAMATRLTTLASGMASFGLYALAFIGGWIEQIGTMVGNATARSLGIVASLLMPSESLWQRASYLMQPPLIRDAGMSPFVVTSVPSAAMVAWAIVFMVVTLGIAMRLFATRDL